MSTNKNNQPSNSHIEKDANGTITKKLRALFLTKKLELGENPTNTSQDWGTDYYIEVLNKDQKNKREMLFLIQCKGVSKSPKILKNDNSFSFNLSLRHANYFYHELSEPLMFMVCDITNDKVFWYAVQLDTQLKDRIIEQANSRKKSLQVKIPADNILNEDNFERFLFDLSESQKAQFHKKREKINLKANYDSVNKSLEGLSTIEGILKFLEIFEGINVFPVSIINKFKVFTGKGGSLHGETLRTDNEDLFDFLDNLQVKDESFHLKNTQVDYAEASDLQDKIYHILNFFRINWISHVTWYGRSDKKRDRICVHDLFISKNCDCERCSYFKLDLSKVVEKLDIQTQTVSNQYQLRKAYTYYLISDFENSFNEHKKVIANIKINKTPGLYIVAKYNLLQLKRMVNWGYFKDARHQILKELENETFALDEILMPDYFLDIFRRISESEFVNNAIWDIDSKLNEIQKNWRSDQFGGSSNNSYARDLIVDFLRAYGFVEYNHIIYNEYREFEVLVNKTMEGIFALYAINNPASSKYDHFGYTIIDMWLFHAEPAHIKYLLSKYKLNSLNMEFSDIEYSRLYEYINNLINSAPIIIQNFKDENFTHTDKIKKIIQNYLLIISVINLSKPEKNVLLKNYLILIETLNEWCFTAFEYLHNFLNFNNDIENENLERIITILMAYNHYGHDAFSTAVNMYSGKFSNGSEAELALKKILQIETFTAEDFCGREKFRDLVFVINRLTKESKEAIKKDIVAKLNEKFDDDLYYMFSIFKVLEYDKSFMTKYLELTPDLTTKQTGSEMLTGKKELKNYHLDRAINLMFHYDVEFTPEIRALSSKALDKDYYDWIMNIDGFDYSKFNPYWILHYKTEAYFKAFRKSQKLKTEIVAGLKENYIEGIAEVLINEL